MRIVQARVAVFSLAITGLAAAGAAGPALAGSSYSYALSGNFSSQGTGTNIPPVGKAQGGGLAAYSNHASVLLFTEAMGLVSKGDVIGEMEVEASGMAMHASNNGPSTTTVAVEGDTSIASAKVTLSLFPTTAGGPTPAPLLELDATTIATSAKDMQTLPLVSVEKGTASFHTLTLKGSLIGNQTLTFTGAAPANTVLYDDAYLTVTLNQQIVTGMIECTPTCQFVPRGMTVNAIAIEMYRDIVAGHQASGQVYIGQSQVAIP